MMKTGIMLLLLGIVSLGLQAQSLTIEQTKQLDKSADSLVCVACRTMISCFQSWDEAKYASAINTFKHAESIYDRLLREGSSYQMTAEMVAILIESKKSMIGSELMLFDEYFAQKMRTIGSDEKMKKKKYKGTVIMVPKSVDFKFDNLVDMEESFTN